MSPPTSPNMEVDYNEWDTYDYPSIGQIAELLRRNDIIPIFAAESGARPIYDVCVFCLWVEYKFLPWSFQQSASYAFYPLMYSMGRTL